VITFGILTECRNQTSPLYMAECHGYSVS
jgi:hypothetical protein